MHADRSCGRSPAVQRPDAAVAVAGREPMRPLLHLPRSRRPPVEALPHNKKLRQPGQRRILMRLPAAVAAAVARRRLRWWRA